MPISSRVTAPAVPATRRRTFGSATSTTATNGASASTVRTAATTSTAKTASTSSTALKNGAPLKTVSLKDQDKKKEIPRKNSRSQKITIRNCMTRKIISHSFWCYKKLD